MLIEPSMGHTLYARRKNGTVARLSEFGERFSIIAPMHARLQREVGRPDSKFTSFIVLDDSEWLESTPCPCIFPVPRGRTWRTLADLGGDIADVLGITPNTADGGFEYGGMRMGLAGLASTFIRSGHVVRTSGGYAVVRLICGD
jgi:hypothetical protein